MKRLFASSNRKGEVNRPTEATYSRTMTTGKETTSLPISISQLALLKITSRTGNGILLGCDMAKCLEVTNAIPSDDSTSQTTKMLKSLKNAGHDSQTLGWYISSNTNGRDINKTMIETQFAYQKVCKVTF
jgi:hypothetical protein